MAYIKQKDFLDGRLEREDETNFIFGGYCFFLFAIPFKTTWFPHELLWPADGRLESFLSFFALTGYVIFTLTRVLSGIKTDRFPEGAKGCLFP